MKGELVYSNNNEDFNFDCPYECLDDMLDNCIGPDETKLVSGDIVGVYTVYEGVTTDIELLEPPGSFQVIPKRSRRFYPKQIDHALGIVDEWEEISS